MSGLCKDYKGELVYGKIASDQYLLINVLYQKPTKETNWNDIAYFILKNVHTGEKKLLQVENPPYLIYYVKPEYRDFDFMRAFVPLNKLACKRIAYKNMENEIAEIGGAKLKEMLTNAMANDFRSAKNIHKYPYVVGTDLPYESYARIEWALHYHNQNISTETTKMYADIEVDGIDIPGFPKPGECPINATSLIDEAGNTVYLFLLRNPKNPLIEEFEKNIDPFIQKLHDAFDETYGVLNYRILMYDDELTMIAHIFATINTLKRDFLLFWNMSFDIPFFMARIQALGADPDDVMCSKDFKTKILYYRKDTRNHDFKKKNDRFVISAYTVYLDQMGQYIKLRKGKSELKSFRLNAIAQKELKDEKLDYSDEADIKTLPYVNYEKFVMYNLKDTLLQMGIERKTHDTDNTMISALMTATPYSALFSQTILLRNYAYMSYFLQGYMIGNNRNLIHGGGKPDKYEEDEDTFEGALVGDPLLNDYAGIPIFGKPSKFIFADVIDFDFKSMYPSIIRSHNINPETMIGKVLLEGFDYLNLDPTDKLYDQGKVFIETYLSHDWGFLGKTYFNLPSIEDLVHEVEHEDCK